MSGLSLKLITSVIAGFSQRLTFNFPQAETQADPSIRARPRNSAIPRTRIMARKGFTLHDYAGRKLARMAREKRIAVRHRGSLRVVADRVVRI